MDAYRKVALQLHGMHSSDQQWLLRHLSEHHRVLLSDMLEELRDLGIPRQPALLDRLNTSSEQLNTGVDRCQEEEQAAANGLEKELLNADPDRVVAVLTREADTTVSAVLSCYPWPWRNQVLECFDKDRREEISLRNGSKAHKLSNRVREALLKALQQKLLEVPSEALTHISTTEPVEHPESRTATVSRRPWFDVRKWLWQS